MKKLEFLKYEENGRTHFSSLVHWDGPKGNAHCLMQAVFLPESKLKIFLAELRTCPRGRGIFFDTDGAANAAWTILKHHFGDLSHFQVDWLTRSGAYSSYDLGHDDSIDRFIIKQDSQKQWRYKEFDDYLLTPPEKQQILQLTNVSDVENDLEKLPQMPPPDV
jgi:hypothetical protein